MIYKDDKGFICRRWNWREADRTKIEKDTKNAILVFEAMPAVSEEKLKKVLAEARELILQFLGGETKEFILKTNHSVINSEFRPGKKSPTTLNKKTISPVKSTIVANQTVPTPNSTPGVGLQGTNSKLL